MPKMNVEKFPELYRELFHILAPSIGGDAAEKAVELIAENFGGRAVYLQKQSKLNRHSRNQAIIAAYREGQRGKDIAKKFNMTRDAAKRILNREGKQPQLSFVETLTEIYREIYNTMSLSFGTSIAETIVMLIMESFGGETLYIPLKQSLYTKHQEDEIVAAFNGRNYRELSQRYKLSMPHIRKVISAHRK